MKAEINIKDKTLPYCAVFLGWSADPTITKHIAAGNINTIFVYDYSDDNSDNVIELFNKIEGKLIVAAWSMGVWAYSCYIRQFLTYKPYKEIALMGTPYGIDKQYGISPETFKATVKHFSKENYTLFLKRAEIPNTPSRSMENIRKELNFLWERKDIKPDIKTISFDFAVCGKHDKIFPPAAQRIFWESMSVRYIETDGGHYPFYNLKKWEHLDYENFISV
ncbi:pimeloyl-ACP methyl esterase BioG family protein [Spirochaetia bacterium 38H-sp]|uniref:Pimeloyl-ACP methyl esterase BioG family protein n=1 Tax=Rarispira pelagica TaxID=3141764 RepID=A0ABU9UC03_9SPIR